MKRPLTLPPILFVCLALPGSGKTQFAHQFAEYLNFIHLSSDRIRAEIAGTKASREVEEEAVFRVMDHITAEALDRDMGVFYDSNSTRRVYRQRLYHLAQCRGAASFLLWFQTPFEVALARVKSRADQVAQLDNRYHSPIDEAFMNRVRDEVEEPEDEPYFIIDGTRPYAQQIERLLGYLATYMPQRT